MIICHSLEVYFSVPKSHHHLATTYTESSSASISTCDANSAVTSATTPAGISTTTADFSIIFPIFTLLWFYHYNLYHYCVQQQQESGSVPEQTHYALVQLTGTLRHVSSCERTFPLLLVTGAVPQVCALLQHFAHDHDVTANVVRILR